MVAGRRTWLGRLGSGITRRFSFHSRKPSTITTKQDTSSSTEEDRTSFADIDNDMVMDHPPVVSPVRRWSFTEGEGSSPLTEAHHHPPLDMMESLLPGESVSEITLPSFPPSPVASTTTTERVLVVMGNDSGHNDGNRDIDDDNDDVEESIHLEDLDQLSDGALGDEDDESFQFGRDSVAHLRQLDKGQHSWMDSQSAVSTLSSSSSMLDPYSAKSPRVRFLPRSTYNVLTTMSLEDYTDEEKFLCFYSRAEYAKMTERSLKMLQRMEQGKPCKRNDSYRGLEGWTENGSRLLERDIELVLEVVGEEQERQWEQNIYDPEAIAEVCRAMTHTTKLMAIHLALADETEIKDYMGTDNDLEEAMTSISLCELSVASNSSKSSGKKKSKKKKKKSKSDKKTKLGKKKEKSKDKDKSKVKDKVDKEKDKKPKAEKRTSKSKTTEEKRPSKSKSTEKRVSRSKSEEKRRKSEDPPGQRLMPMPAHLDMYLEENKKGTDKKAASLGC